MNASKRLSSLDVLRGITISFMILVNTPGSWEFVYAPLRHAKWNGCTPTDFVFPFFLFIVGVSVWLSFKKYDTRLSTTSFLKIVKRAAIIFLLGLILNLFPYFNFGEVRIMGVLQRIAIAYGIGAILCLGFKKKELLAVLGVLLIGYWILLFFGSAIDPFSLKENIVGKFDLMVLGEKHMYHGFGIPFDTEGLLSTIPSIGTVIIGYLVGQMISSDISLTQKMRKLLIQGIVLVVLGSVWGIVFPINKALWTSSYVLYTAGFAILFLTLLIFIIDYKGYKKWSKPFIHFGMNPLFIFVFSGLYGRTINYLIKIAPSDGGPKISAHKYLFSEVFSPIAGNMNGSLFFALSHILAFWLICFLLYKNKIFIKI